MCNFSYCLANVSSEIDKLSRTILYVNFADNSKVALKIVTCNSSLKDELCNQSHYYKKKKTTNKNKTNFR